MSSCFCRDYYPGCWVGLEDLQRSLSTPADSVSVSGYQNHTHKVCFGVEEFCSSGWDVVPKPQLLRSPKSRELLLLTYAQLCSSLLASWSTDHWKLPFLIHLFFPLHTFFEWLHQGKRFFCILSKKLSTERQEDFFYPLFFLWDFLACTPKGLKFHQCQFKDSLPLDNDFRNKRNYQQPNKSLVLGLCCYCKILSKEGMESMDKKNLSPELTHSWIWLKKILTIDDIKVFAQQCQARSFIEWTCEEN